MRRMAVVGGTTVGFASGRPQNAGKKHDNDDGDDYERGRNMHLRDSLFPEYQNPGKHQGPGWLQRFHNRCARPGPWCGSMIALFMFNSAVAGAAARQNHQRPHHVVLFMLQDVAVPHILVSILQTRAWAARAR
jgi:hypothetical protein